ncbi:hypothetical protein MGYG_01879 [Nannizzia gypsea CBS 118893]|uniref:Uncharacterized protein n=1 Tax=Arthroderma gypseum (strain ATCC MYA-4604 / CBS 118893) TaxID=535722 RepID=E5QYK1_ARTGP|nr:hypothetical protein MGYG_01879 [Nannizzia gypsea CBS 118893]EFQ98864.1 hypothetical protein MGYG_01879 [Nannizzia gypsea CBS 118893]
MQQSLPFDHFCVLYMVEVSILTLIDFASLGKPHLEEDALPASEPSPFNPAPSGVIENRGAEPVGPSDATRMRYPRAP